MFFRIIESRNRRMSKGEQVQLKNQSLNSSNLWRADLNEEKELEQISGSSEVAQKSNDHGYQNGIPAWIAKKKEKVPQLLSRLQRAISVDIARKDKEQYLNRLRNRNNSGGEEWVDYYSKDEAMEINQKQLLGFEDAQLPENVKVFVIETNDRLEDCLKYACSNGKPKFLGFDCEWLPVNNKNENNQIDLLQLAFDNCVLLIRVCKSGLERKRFPSLFTEILEDEHIFKFCQDPQYEVNVLKMLWDIDIKGMVDTACIGDLFCCRPFGLFSLVALFLSRRLRKDPVIQCSNWKADSLSIKQINYAAVDAWMSKEVALNMLESYLENYKLDSIDEAIKHIYSQYQNQDRDWISACKRNLHNLCSWLQSQLFEALKIGESLKRKAESISPDSEAGSNPSKKIKTGKSDAPPNKKVKTEAQKLRQRRKKQKQKARKKAALTTTNE
jgi:hypothetical protein